MDLQLILSSMKWEIGAIDQHLAGVTNARHPVLSEPVSYLLTTDGKKLRAVLVYASARLGSYEPEQLIRAAAAVETLHLASLVHDDILDDSCIRRGKATVNLRWGIGTALLTGDFLYARCFSLLHTLGTEVMTVLLDTIVDMVEGELRQQQCRRNLGTTWEEYLAIIQGKTASFISACCTIGGIIGGLKPEQIDYLRNYGDNLGIAFQIRDDIIDYDIAKDLQGKPPGNDLRQGIVTLPLLAYLKECSGSERAALEQVVTNPDPDPMEISYICGQIRDSGVLARCAEWVDKYVDRALVYLDFLPPGPYLHQIANTLRLDKTRLN